MLDKDCNAVFVTFFQLQKKNEFKKYLCLIKSSHYKLDKLFVLCIKSGTNHYLTVNSLIYQNVNKQMTQVFVYKTEF